MVSTYGLEVSPQLWSSDAQMGSKRGRLSLLARHKRGPNVNYCLQCVKPCEGWGGWGGGTAASFGLPVLFRVFSH